VHDTAITVLRAEAVPRFPRALDPGEGARVDGFALVRTGDGALRLLEGEIDGAAADAVALAALFPG
jgi:methionyl-tRNA formyltransferase